MKGLAPAARASPARPGCRAGPGRGEGAPDAARQPAARPGRHPSAAQRAQARGQADRGRPASPHAPASRETRHAGRQDSVGIWPFVATDAIPHGRRPDPAAEEDHASADRLRRPLLRRPGRDDRLQGVQRRRGALSGAPGPPDLGRSQSRGPRHQGGARPRAVCGELSLAGPAGAARLLRARARRPGVPGAHQLHGDGDHLADHARPGPPGHRGPPRSARRHRLRPLRGRARRGRRGRERPRRRRDGPRRQASPGADLVPRLGHLRRGDAHARGGPGAARAARPGRTTPATRPFPSTSRPRSTAAPRCSSPPWAARPSAATTTARSSAPRSTTPRWREARPPVRAGRDLRPPPGGGLGLQSRDLQHPRGGRGAERAPRRAGQPPGSRHDGLDLDGPGDVLAPRARRVRRHPLPRRRPLRLRVGHRLHLHRAGRAPERRLRGAARGGRRRGHDPVLRPPAARAADGGRLRAHADVHLHRVREHRARRHQRRVPGARGGLGGAPVDERRAPGLRAVHVQLPPRRERHRLLLAPPARS